MKIKKPEEQLQRKDIVDILVVDHKIPESTAYRYYADSLREYEWEQEKSGDPTRIDKNKKSSRPSVGYSTKLQVS